MPDQRPGTTGPDHGYSQTPEDRMSHDGGRVGDIMCTYCSGRFEMKGLER